jgi:hypothetical protein
MGEVSRRLIYLCRAPLLGILGTRGKFGVWHTVNSVAVSLVGMLSR